jgi:hypothetical protein
VVADGIRERIAADLAEEAAAVEAEAAERAHARLLEVAATKDRELVRLLYAARRPPRFALAAARYSSRPPHRQPSCEAARPDGRGGL